MVRGKEVLIDIGADELTCAEEAAGRFKRLWVMDRDGFWKRTVQNGHGYEQMVSEC